MRSTEDANVEPSALDYLSTSSLSILDRPDPVTGYRRSDRWATENWRGHLSSRATKGTAGRSDLPGLEPGRSTVQRGGMHGGGVFGVFMLVGGGAFLFWFFA